MGATMVTEDCLMAMAMIVLGNHVLWRVKTAQRFFEFQSAVLDGERRLVNLAPGEDGMVLMPSPT
jgi:hypothetical protein